MPLRGDVFEQRDADDILAFLEAELQSEFGTDIDLTESSVWWTFATAVAETDASQLQPALEEVHEAAFLEKASGDLLEDLVYILGIERREAVHATGTVTFQHGSLVTQDYTVPNGTVVQTDSQDPVQFETTELVSLSWFDDFESGALRTIYSGDTSAFDVVDESESTTNVAPTDGTYALEASSDGHIYNTAQKTEIGDECTYQTYLTNESGSNATVGNTFGVVDGSNYYRIRLGDGATHNIEKVVAGSTQTLQSASPTVPTNEWLRNEVLWLPRDNGTIVSRVYDSTDALLDEIEVNGIGGDIAVGGFGFENLDASEPCLWDHSAQTAASANVRAVEGGTRGNVGANTLVSLPSVPNGVNAVTNKHPTGDDDYYLTSLTQFTLGLPRESDEGLRERATVSEGAVGDATVPALIADATSLPGAESVSVYENTTADDNTGTGGLPPNSFELVFYGTTPNEDIAQMLHNVRAFTAEDYGGAHGTRVTETVEASNGQTFDLEWTEPSQLGVDITLDIVVNDEYVGNEALRERIVSHVGGTLPDGTTALGLGTSEDVYVDQIEDIVTGPDDTGVIGISSYSFTPSTTTDANGLEVVSVGANETATVDGTDASITINVTEV